MFVLGGSNSGSMPHNLKMSDMADSPKMTNEQWQQFNRLLQEKDPELGRVMKNADMFLETVMDHNKTLRDVATGCLAKIKPELADHLREKFPHEIPAVQRTRF